MSTLAPPPAALDGHGLFGPETMTWRVNREMVLLAGGGRALLLQVAHPLVAAGVTQHSNYREDPWGRLYRTLDLTTQITFGDARTSHQASRRLQAAHRRVHGVADDGTPYDARDPDLLLWVWATLVESSLLVYTRYVDELTSAEVERYYQEQKRFAAACGVPDGHCPATHGDFSAYWERMVSEELDVTDGALAVAQATLHPALPLVLRLAARGPFELLNLFTVGLLPGSLRRQYGVSWGPGREAALQASTRAIRGVLPLLPALLRDFPAARATGRPTA